MLSLRIAGKSAAVIREAEVRIRANAERGRSWARAAVSVPREWPPAHRCACGAPLTSPDWLGAATIRCDQCSSRWHVTAYGSSTLTVSLSGPSEAWLETYRPVQSPPAALAGSQPDDADQWDEAAELERYLRPHPELQAALDPVRRDLSAIWGIVTSVEAWTSPYDQTAIGRLWSPGGKSCQVAVELGDPIARQIVRLADSVQEWVVEERWAAGLPAIWPECPRHPDSHPLDPQIVGSQAVWQCGPAEETIAGIGALAVIDGASTKARATPSSSNTATPPRPTCGGT